MSVIHNRTGGQNTNPRPHRSALSPSAGLALAMLLIAGVIDPAGAQERAIPLSDDYLIGECDGLAAADRDRCLAAAALRNDRPALCESASSSGCQDLAARAGVASCADSQDGSARFGCEMMVLERFPSPQACDASVDSLACIGFVAAEREEPNLIAERVEDPQTMEQAMVMYVGTTGDLRGLDYIQDAYLHDQALVYGASAAGIRHERLLGTAYCDRLRGNYESGHEGMSAQSLTGLCRVYSGVIDRYVSAQQSVELADQRDLLEEEFARRLAEVAEALDAGTMELSDIPAAMGAPVDPIPAPLGVDCSSTGWGTVRFTNGGATWTGTYADGYNLRDRDAPDVAETGTLSFRFDWATRTGTGNWGQPSISREGTFPEASVNERDGRVEISFTYEVTARGDQSLVSARMSAAGQSGRGTITCPQ